MRKQEIEVGGEYAVHFGYGRTTRHKLSRCKVLALDYQEPLDDDASFTARRRNPKGTRVEVLTSEHYAAKKGEKRIVRNADIIEPWATYSRSWRNGEIHEEYHDARRKADRAAEVTKANAWDRFAKAIEPGADRYEREVPRLNDSGYVEAAHLDVHELVALIRRANKHGAGIERLAKSADRADRICAKAVAKARVIRDEKLTKAGFEVPGNDEDW